MDQIAIQACGDLKLEPPVAVAQLVEGDEDAGGIHMSLHDVAGEARRRRHGAFQIHARAGDQVA